MKKMMVLLTAILLAPSLLARAAAAAQDPKSPTPAAKPADAAATVAGKWNGAVDAGQGPMDLQIDLKLDGKKVTGTLTGQQGTMDVTNGEFADNKLTFTIAVDTAQGPLTVVFTATLKDNALTGTADAGQVGSFPFHAERPKDK
jgi:opacity protein-like surface antigen